MNEIVNFARCSDLIATSGQPAREQFVVIACQGYSAVINLAMPDSNRAIADEGSVVTSLGMTYVHIPIPFDAPNVAHLQQFIAVMRALEGNKIWVHCARNWRVSAFMYHYLRIEKGLPPEQCRLPVLDEWEPHMDEVWKGFLGLSHEEIAAHPSDS